MIRYFILLSLIGLFTLSCEKSKLKKMKDDISWRKYDPFLVLKPADSVGQISNFGCVKPFHYPSDSTVSVEVDVNKDGQNDYRFTYSTFYNLISPSDSCKNYSSIIKVKAIGVGNSVLISNSDNLNKLQVFERDQKIPNGSKLAAEGILLRDNISGSVDIAIEPEIEVEPEFQSGNKYIGVQLFGGETGWIKFFHTKDSISFSIMEHAYNRNIHLDIQAGQKN